MPKVYIAQSWSKSQYNSMFEDEGWEVVSAVKDCDLIQFVGGADVNPALYKHNVHPTTHFREVTDVQDSQIFELGKRLGKPMAGICRGGQFLNVCNGGTLVQHLDGHAIGANHMALDVIYGATIEVSSTHHQMMVPHEDAKILMVAKQSSYKLICKTVEEDIQASLPDDIEALYYAKYKSLCFQPHPEFNHVPDCRKYYFACIKTHLGIG